MKYLACILIIYFFLVGRSLYANDNWLLSVENFNSLSALQKRNYILDFRKLHLEFENQLNQDDVFISSLINLLFFFPAGAYAENEKCMVGGQLLFKIGNKCSVKNKTCQGAGSFKCGLIFGGICLKKANIKTISKDCYDLSKNGIFDSVKYQALKEGYEKTLYDICNNSPTEGCSYFKEKINDLNNKNTITKEIERKINPDGVTIQEAILKASKGMDELKKKNAQFPSSTQQAFCSNCTLLNGSNQASSNNPCELKVQDHKIINAFGVVGVWSAYRLTRMSSNEYQAEVNLQLKSTSPMSTEEVNEYNTIIEKCYEHGADFLKGPDGKKLKLRLSHDKKVPISKISLVSTEDHRSDATAWNISILDRMDCSTIIHESLHLLGLVDLYPEESVGLQVSHGGPEVTGAPLAYQCRVIAKTAANKNLIMNDNYSAYACAMGSEKYQVSFCECPDSSQCDGNKIIEKKLCKDIRYSIEVDLISDYSGNKEILEERIRRKFNSTAKKDHPGKKVYITEIKQIEATPKACSTLLTPAEFQFITVPTCPKNKDTNKNYLSCGANAYYPSTQRENQQCKPMEAICQGENDEWLR